MEKLNIESLQIGDWILDGSQKAQITSITFDGSIGTTADEDTNIEFIEPIPITPEVLEKNGFEYDHYYHCWIYDEFTINYGHLLEEDDNDYLSIW